MKRIIRNNCGTNFITHNSTLLGPITVNINNIEDYISIGEKYNIGSNYWYISLNNPKYLKIHGNKMNQKEKDEFINIVSNNWKNIVQCIEEECVNLCDFDKETCNHYYTRSILKIPDYTLL